ncbi:phosphatidate cytidylyltransferase [Tuberibacillus sp. Marseille-P3662]|uniref:phosphatidate cytidylyltransferase n=1 Tax=Tuberibacillus sp. Marseille-P3662 TaxID=1965358 RepID=UPI000A1CE55E|nr:phosphatidate cytidylyltransferase [Tuberibacillus sp. Marseille-P3662]
MKERILTGVIAGALFLLVLWYGSWAFTLLAMLIAAIIFTEFMFMKNIRAQELPSMLGILSVLFLVNHDLMDPMNISPLLSVTAVLLLIYSFISHNRFHVDHVAYTFFAVFYTGYGFGLLVNMRHESLLLILFVLILIWATDSGAYFIGKKMGKNKLAPSISPNKTIEGSLGGIIVALVVAFLFQQWVEFDILHSSIMIYIVALIVAVFGQMGDLAESALKRYLDVKDSGKILPGHGGLLDRFDSLLFVLPALHIIGVI